MRCKQRSTSWGDSPLLSLVLPIRGRVAWTIMAQLPQIELFVLTPSSIKTQPHVFHGRMASYMALHCQMCRVMESPFKTNTNSNMAVWFLVLKSPWLEKPTMYGHNWGIKNSFMNHYKDRMQPHSSSSKDINREWLMWLFFLRNIYIIYSGLESIQTP